MEELFTQDHFNPEVPNENNFILLDAEDQHKLAQYNEVNLRELNNWPPEIDLTKSRANITRENSQISFIEKIYIALGSKVVTPDNKTYIVEGQVTSINKYGQLLTRVVEYNNGIYRSTNKSIPIFDKNGKLIVKIIVE